MSLGRDIGKLKKEGYLRGTKGYRFRNIFLTASVTIALLISGVFGGFYIKTQEGRFVDFYQRHDRGREERQERIEMMRLKRLEMKAALEEESPKTVDSTD